MKLYEICLEIQSILDDIDAGVIGETDAAVELDALGKDGDEKIRNICGLIKNLEAESGAIDAEVSRLRKRSKSLEGRIDWLKNYIGSAVGEGNRWVNGVHRISWRRSKAVVVLESLLDGKWWREKLVREPDKLAIKAELEAGNAIAGAVLNERWNMQIT